MAQETLVAVFDHAAHANAAVDELERSGVATSDIERHAREALGVNGSTAPEAARSGDFWRYLFGDATTPGQNAVYDRVVHAGGEVVTVLLRDSERDADRVMLIIERYGPVDVSERAASYGAAPAGTSEAPAAATFGSAGEQTLQLSEERLTIGKRTVDRGTTRLHRFVRTRAIEETVTLRDETVSLERRVVADGAIVGPDAFADKIIEMTETREEVVITKVARVREEIVLHKQVTERMETIRDNLRSEEIEIDAIAPAAETGVQPAPSGLVGIPGQRL